MKKLQASYSDDAKNVVEKVAQEKSAKENLKFMIDLAMVAEVTKPTEDEPQPIIKAWDYSNSKSRQKLQDAIWKEFGSMKKQQV